MSIKSLVLGLAVAVSLGSTAKAVNLVINGGLERPDTITSAYVNSYPPGAIPSWTVHGAPGNLGTFNSVYIYDTIPDTVLPAYMPASYYSCTSALGFVSGNSCLNPGGTGHFINLDGDQGFPAAISQSIAGLTLNGKYTVTFDWAAVQRSDEFGPTSGYFLDVSLGGQHFLTSSITGPLSLPSGGFSGWYTTSYTFTWDGLNSNLNFLAHGLPSGLPPSMNLDNISLTAAVPEPATLEMMIAGISGLMAVVARRRRKTAVD